MRQRCCLPLRTFSVGSTLPLTSSTAPSRPKRSPKLPPLSAGTSSPRSSSPMSDRSKTRSSPNAWRIGRVVDDERAVEAAADLRRRVRVRVIPVRAGVAQLELVAELAAGLDRRLRDAGRAVHLVRHAQAVPVDRRRLGQRVLEVDDDAIAELGAHHRARHGAVIGPRRRRRAGQDLDVRDAGFELDLEHVRVGIQIRAGPASRARRPSPRAGSRRARLAVPSAGSAARSQPAQQRRAASQHWPQQSFPASVCSRTPYLPRIGKNGERRARHFAGAARERPSRRSDICRPLRRCGSRRLA